MSRILKSTAEGKIPDGALLVRTTHGAKEVELYGTNKRGIRIPLDKVDDFIGELEQTCIDSQTLYKLGREESFMEVPGFKVQKVSQYLREARDIGVMLAQYQKIF